MKCQLDVADKVNLIDADLAYFIETEKLSRKRKHEELDESEEEEDEPEKERCQGCGEDFKQLMRHLGQKKGWGCQSAYEDYEKMIEDRKRLSQQKLDFYVFAIFLILVEKSNLTTVHCLHTSFADDC